MYCLIWMAFPPQFTFPQMHHMFSLYDFLAQVYFLVNSLIFLMDSNQSVTAFFFFSLHSSDTNGFQLFHSSLQLVFFGGAFMKILQLIIFLQKKFLRVLTH